ncbi:hypothetical protein FHX08_002315 [Rhizobium sp. BK529]|nr:hypothetical protein [Rhizobium sp. BK529]
MIWTGRVLTGLFALFMLGASIAPKLLGLSVAEETMTQLGWPNGYVLMIGLIELICLVLYLIPQTSVFGAVLMMGWVRWRRRSAPEIRSSATFCSASISGCSCGAGCG